MLFSTVSYFVFFFTVLAAFYLGPARWRVPLLLAASYFFYASWNWKFVPLLLTLTAIDYFAAQWIENHARRGRRLALCLSLAANLGFLGVFKYYNFAAYNFALLLGLPQNQFYFDIVLPLGISFHTFQSMSYVIDVYRGEQQAIRRPLDYALFISFFPQLVAGPIVRAREFFGDLYAWRAPSMEEVKSGAFQVVLGLVKKVALADNFAGPADAYFGAVWAHPGALSAWGGALAFAPQIYFDFSGYTDIAIGCALLLGFHFPINFRRPYLATSITDFWRRWHISLSRWLRDYLYIPLGGNRGGKWETYRNLMLTMLLGGMWHGANWTFLVWGGFHGVLLALERMAGVGRDKSQPWSAAAAPRIVATFALVCIGWVFFRARTFGEAWWVLGQMATFRGGAWPIEPVLMWMAAVALVLAVVEEQTSAAERLAGAPRWAVGLTLGGMLLLVELFSSGQSLPFVYFQF